MTVSWFAPQNQASFGLSVVPQNQREDDDSTGHVLRYNSLLCLEACRARVSQSGHKTGGGVARMVHVASSWRSRGEEAEDGRVNTTGCIGLFDLNFIVFSVLGPKGILVFWLDL
jgi:hypothetical protein